jgi:hypothetical protein
VKGAGDMIRKELLKWDNVTVHEHQFGSIVFRVGGEEVGHLHSDVMADIYTCRQK